VLVLVKFPTKKIDYKITDNALGQF